MDPNPAGSATIDGTRRMAWLLATSRLLAASTSSLTRHRFVSRLRAEGLSVDAPRLSRLESGTQRPSLAVLQAYESHTGLGRGVLVAADSLLARVSGDKPAFLAHLDSAQHDLDWLLERVSAGEADASDWLSLAAGMTGYDRVYVHSSAWTELTKQLLGELTRAVGPAFVARHEAAALLLSHDHVRGHVTRSLGRFVMDPAVQSITPSLALLAEVGDQGAADLLVRLMGDASPLLRHGAIGVMATLAGRTGVDASMSGTLEQHVAREMAKGGPIVRRLDAIELAVELPEGSLNRVLATTPDLALRRRALLARRQHETVESDVARSVSEGAAERVERSVGRRAQDPDQMLSLLLREGLFHLRRERRHLAAALLGASHYAPAVAEEVLDLTGSDDEMVAAASWSLLRRLGHVVSREQLAGHVLAETRTDVYPRALVSLGLSHGAMPAELSARLAEDAVSHELSATRHASLFALGLAGDPVLRSLARVEPSRQGAQWWLSVGPAVLDGSGQR